MILLQVELMEPEIAKVDAKRVNAKFIGKLDQCGGYGAGCGEICLFSAPSLDVARRLIKIWFGDDPNECGELTETIPGVYFTHAW